MTSFKKTKSINLEKNPANFWALTPISFLLRSANIWPERIAWIHGNKKNNYKQLLSRCTKISSGLRKKGLKKNRKTGMGIVTRNYFILNLE